MAASTPFIVDADLHGLVDGLIEPERRADALRRLAASPADRARVEAWQGQSDLLKSAFAGIDREPLPALLDLKSKPRLHCVPANDAPMVGTIGGPRLPPRRTRFGLALATMALVATGLGTTWIVLNSADSDDPVTSARLRGTVDATVAARSTDAVGTADAAERIDPHAGIALPTTEIPDLRAAGFDFTGAKTENAEPPSIQFRYRNSKADRIVVTVARAAPGAAPLATIVRIGDAYSWRKGNNAYALAGTLRRERLKTIAVSLASADLAD